MKYIKGAEFCSKSLDIFKKIRDVDFKGLANPDCKYNPEGDSGVAKNVFKNGISIWFLTNSNLCKNRQDKEQKWFNTICDNETVVIENYLQKMSKDFDEDYATHRRLIFVKINGHDYKFLGLFDVWEADRKTKQYIVYKMISDVFDESFLGD